MLVGQENGVIVGFMKTYLFEDMVIWKHGLLSHIMMMTSYFMMIGLIIMVDAYQMRILEKSLVKIHS